MPVTIKLECQILRILRSLMKRIFFLLLISFFFIQTSTAKSYRIGDVITNNIEFSKKYIFELPSGSWTVADRYSYSYYGIITKGYRLLKIINGKAVEGFSIGELKVPVKWQSQLNSALYEIVFKNKYDGCYERPEYYILEFFAKGSSHNCFWIGHEDVYKELFDPEDPEIRGVNAQYKAWLRNNGIELPKVAIGSSHSYFSRLTGGKWFVLNHGFDPEYLGAPKSKFISEDRSEYHKYNISDFPKHKIIMEKVISIGAARHKKFELEVGAKDHHKINLEKYVKNFDTNKVSVGEDNILSKLNKLKKLYDNGVLTEDEFKKAKNKILN